MKGREACPDLRYELKRTATEDDDGKQHVAGDGDVAYRIARHVAIEQMRFLQPR
jgi:hypothetical protein